jgi:hypothetical protein
MKSIISAILVAGSVALVSQVHAQPAPKLTYLQVVAVQSTGYPAWDYLSDNTLLTNMNHTGPVLIVATKELGYSSSYSQVAKFNGVKMTSLGQDPILNGRTVVGYIRYWRYQGPFTSGQFTYEASSINFPYNKMSDWVNIK